MTLEQAAKQSGREASTLRRAAIRGTLKAEKIGHMWTVTQAALDDYLTEAARRRPDLQRTEATPDGDTRAR